MSGPGERATRDGLLLNRTDTLRVCMPGGQGAQRRQTRSVTAPHGCSSYASASHGRHGWHTRSRAAVHPSISKEPCGQRARQCCASPGCRAAAERCCRACFWLSMSRANSCACCALDDRPCGQRVGRRQHICYGVVRWSSVAGKGQRAMCSELISEWNLIIHAGSRAARHMARNRFAVGTRSNRGSTVAHL
jgi:hypothetical protein